MTGRPSTRAPLRLVAFDWGHTLMDECLNGEVMPDVLDVLPRLELPLAVWANTRTAREREVRDWLSRCGIDRFFRWVVTSVDAGARKPDPLFFEFALARCAVARHDVLFVGNQLNTDVAGGEAFGIQTALLTGEAYRSRDDAPVYGVMPTYQIERLGELPDLIRRIRGERE